jgi:hypothetical protein
MQSWKGQCWMDVCRLVPYRPKFNLETDFEPGMACRLALDIGLNLDCAYLRIFKEEVRIRHMVFLACIVQDA